MSTAKKKILLVEDEASLREVFTMVLETQSYVVRTATDGVDAFKKLSTFVPDLILLDYFMPVMDGKTFLENLDLSQYPDTVIIVASNVSDKTVLNELLELGAHSYVLKAHLSPGGLLKLVSDSLPS